MLLKMVNPDCQPASKVDHPQEAIVRATPFGLDDRAAGGINERTILSGSQKASCYLPTSRRSCVA
jgi:hypothetical protein